MGASFAGDGIAAGMSDFQQQLAHLRRRIAKIDRKYADPKPRQPMAPEPLPIPTPEDYLAGEEVKTALGHHFELEKLYERNRRHGSIGIADLEDMPGDLLAS